MAAEEEVEEVEDVESDEEPTDEIDFQDVMENMSRQLSGAMFENAKLSAVLKKRNRELKEAREAVTALGYQINELQNTKGAGKSEGVQRSGSKSGRRPRA